MGTGTIQPDVPMCPCAVQDRDRAGHDLLWRHELLKLAFLQRVALRGRAVDDHGAPLPPHRLPYRDYRAS